MDQISLQLPVTDVLISDLAEDVLGHDFVCRLTQPNHSLSYQPWLFLLCFFAFRKQHHLPCQQRINAQYYQYYIPDNSHHGARRDQKKGSASCHQSETCKGPESEEAEVNQSRQATEEIHFRHGHQNRSNAGRARRTPGTYWERKEGQEGRKAQGWLEEIWLNGRARSTLDCRPAGASKCTTSQRVSAPTYWFLSTCEQVCLRLDLDGRNLASQQTGEATTGTVSHKATGDRATFAKVACVTCS